MLQVDYLLFLLSFLFCYRLSSICSGLVPFFMTCSNTPTMKFCLLRQNGCFSVCSVTHLPSGLGRAMCNFKLSVLGLPAFPFAMLNLQNKKLIIVSLVLSYMKYQEIQPLILDKFRQGNNDSERSHTNRITNPCLSRLQSTSNRLIYNQISILVITVATIIPITNTLPTTNNTLPESSNPKLV